MRVYNQNVLDGKKNPSETAGVSYYYFATLHYHNYYDVYDHFDLIRSHFKDPFNEINIASMNNYI